MSILVHRLLDNARQTGDMAFANELAAMGEPPYYGPSTHWVAEDYFSQLRAARKRLEMFEDSGHGQIWQEADKFHALMQEVLAETYPVAR